MNQQPQLDQAEKLEWIRSVTTAVEGFAKKVSVPLMYEGPEKCIFVGTGTLFKICDRVFLVTAAHVVKGVPDAGSLVFPTNPMSGHLRTLGSMNVNLTNENCPDVAVLELTDKKVLEVLEANWNFCTLENVLLTVPPYTSENPRFLLIGYPAAMTKSEAERASAAILTAYLHKKEGIPTDLLSPYDEKVDIFLDYAGVGYIPGDRPIEKIALEGTSGGSICCMMPCQGVWAPSKAFKIIAVQSSYRKNDFVRGKKWTAVAQVIMRIDDQMKDAVRATFGTN